MAGLPWENIGKICMGGRVSGVGRQEEVLNDVK